MKNLGETHSHWCLNAERYKSVNHLHWCLNTELANLLITYIGAWTLSIQICESLTLVPEYWVYKSVNHLLWCLNTDMKKFARNSLALVPEHWAYKSVNHLYWFLNTELTDLWITYIDAWILILQICESLTLVPEYWAYKFVNHLHWCLNTELTYLWITYIGAWILTPLSTVAPASVTCRCLERDSVLAIFGL